MARDDSQRDRANRWLLIAAVGLTVGGLLILTSVLFPRPDDPADYAGFLELMRENETRTKAVMLTVPVGIWLFALGIQVPPRVAPTSPAMDMVRVAGFAILIGAAAVTVQFSLAAAAFAEADEGVSDLSVILWAAATYVRSFGMLVFWLGVALVGLGMVMDARFARWLAWPPVVIGIGLAGVSIVAILAGPSSATGAGSGILAALTAVWAISFGVWLMRQRDWSAG